MNSGYSPKRKIVSVWMNQAALSNASDCDELGSWATQTCKTLYFRNPKTTATLVTHVLRGNCDIQILLPELQKISEGEPLEVSVFAGHIDGKSFIQETSDEVDKVIEAVVAHGIPIIKKRLDLGAHRAGVNVVMELRTGELRDVEDAAVKPYLADRMITDDVRIIYNGLGKCPSKT